jgi:glycosyltransferase involved in cell wall biosynthesis
MDWLPNDDAIRYLIDAILPRIRESVPDVTLTVVGRNPSSSLVELARRDPSVTFTGRVEDVRPYIERAAAFVIPLRIGGGTRLKLYEAMGMEKPVVSTSMGAEGLPVRHGRELLLADTAEAFAASVVRVLTEPALARQLADTGARLVRGQFGWSGVTEVFAELCHLAIERRASAAAAAVGPA